MQDSVNGIQILLEEIDKTLSHPKLTEKDRLSLRCHSYLLKSLIPIREDVAVLKKNDLIGWLRKQPPKRIVIGVIILYLTSISDTSYFFQWLKEMFDLILKLL